MTPRRWYAIATMMMMVAVAGVSQAGDLGRVANGDCEQGGDDQFDIPGWTNDRPNLLTFRADAIGTDGSAACVVVGPNVLRSAELFSVTAGETLTISADVNELRGDDIFDDGVADSVVAIEFVTVDGKSPFQLELHCDEIVAGGCDILTGPQSISANVVVPSGALYGRVLLGGSFVTDPLDLLFGISLNSPTAIVAFDNIAVDTA